MSTRILTIANQKGGVGKTTTAISLAHGLALKGKNVLLADFDPQGQVARFLGMDATPGVYILLMNEPSSEKAVAYIKDQVHTSNRDNLWVLPGNKKTMVAQNEIASTPINHVRNALEIFMRRGLDYIVIDTSPSVGGLQERAIWASDLLVIPTAPEYASLEGVSQLFQDVVLLQREKRWGGALLGVLPTLYDEQTRMSRESMENLRGAFGDRVLPPIHRATILRDCTAEGLTVFEKDTACRAAEEYRTLVDLVIRAR
jgi:chromosome partitioning protein